MIRQANTDDIETLTELAVILWGNHSKDELSIGFNQLISTDNAVFFIYYDESTPIGFAQSQLRFDYVEGTQSSPVGYLEGIFILDDYRHKGYAKQLVKACEDWAKSKGCLEFASDCELDNSISLKFHLGIGFEEANRIICFTKKL